MKISFVVVVFLIGVGPLAAVELPTIRATVHEARTGAAMATPIVVPQERSAVGSGMTARATLREVNCGQRADVVVGDTTGSEREIAIALHVRLPAGLTHFFLTDGQGPQKLGPSGSAAYRSGLPLPAVTLFGPHRGVTIAAPFEVPTPALTFHWQRAGDEMEVTIRVTNLRLPARGTAHAGLLVGSHAGCWRPGLGWLVELYPAYFLPPNPQVFDYDGPMIYDFVTPESRLRRDLSQDLAWQELGWYWPHLGLYKPDGERWKRQPGSDGGLGAGGDVSCAMLNDFIGRSNRLGIAQCLYFQSTESWAEYAERTVPESRVRSAQGALCPTWIKCVVMDPNPDGPFGKHILDQARRLVETFPGMAGVFWDQNCYTGFDYAHDDGISMVDGRHVSMLEFPQNRLLALGGKFFHDHGKVIFTNGGWTAGLARYCDGHMSEGTGPTRQLQYICMMKPLTLLAYDSDLASGKEKLRLALETGAQPSVTLGDDACRALFDAYRPIFRLLRHKQWVFHPHALALSEGVRGNVFRNQEGNYVVTAIADQQKTPSPTERHRPLNVELHLPDASEIRQALAWSPDVLGWRKADVTRTADGLKVGIPYPDSCGAAVLVRRGRWISAETSRLLAGRKEPVRLTWTNLTGSHWTGPWEIIAGAATQRGPARVTAMCSETLALGPVEAPEAGRKVSLRVRGPGPDGTPTESTIEVPVVAPVGISIAECGNGRVLKGEPVGYALANRLDEDLPIEIRMAWHGPTSITRSAQVVLKAGEVRALAASTDLPRGGTWSLEIDARWSGGSSRSTARLNVADAVLPKDFRLEDAEDLTLQMDLFNSLDGQWAEKMVRINGLPAGRLPITGPTLKWHNAMPLHVAGQAARDILRHGLTPDGTIRLCVVIDNKVCNCFKVRSAQATLRTRSGETFVSTWSRHVHCSDTSWLYAEGECVPNGQPLPLEALSFLK